MEMEMEIKIKLKNNESITLRSPALADAPAILKYINTIAQEDTFINLANEEMTLEDEQNYLKKITEAIEKQEAAHIFAINSGNKIVGISGIEINRDNRSRSLHVGIFGISIAKEYRGLGLGSQLMQTVIDEAMKNIKGLKSIVLYCYANNEAAKNLYLKMGFEIVGNIKQGIFRKGEYVDELIMQLSLPNKGS